MNRALMPFVESVASGEPPSPQLVERARSLLQLDEAARRRRLEKSRPRRKAEAVQAQVEASAMEQAHDAVWLWNIDHTRDAGAPYGRCDCGCGGAFLYFEHGEWDHWIPRAQGGEDARENGWRLLPACHEARHDEKPPVDAPPDAPARPNWNARRATYCARAGIPFVPRRVKA